MCTNAAQKLNTLSGPPGFCRIEFRNIANYSSRSNLLPTNQDV